MARRLDLLLCAALAAGAVSLLPAPATADPIHPHPYFQDAGTLDWHTSVDEAASAARASGRLVFIEYGRRKCGNCRATVETVLPSGALRARVSALCVGLAAECDAPDPRVEALFARWLPDASILPFCAFVTADLRWVDGWAGLIGTADCLRRVGTAEPVCARWRAVTSAATPPCARGAKAPGAFAPPAPPTSVAPAAAPAVAPRPNPAAAPATARPPATAKPPYSPWTVRRPSPAPTPLPPADDASGEHAGCGDEGEMECEGGVCRLVRRHAPTPPDATHPGSVAAAPPPDAAPSEPVPADVAPPPAAQAPAGLAIAPTAPRQTLPHATREADLATARELLAQAVSAAGRDAYGEVIRLHAEAARLPVIADPLAWNSLHARASAWIRAHGAPTAAAGDVRPTSTR